MAIWRDIYELPAECPHWASVCICTCCGEGTPGASPLHWVFLRILYGLTEAELGFDLASESLPPP